jgi:hypothetical protein
VDADLFDALFQDVLVRRNLDISEQTTPGHVVVSERGEMVEQVMCKVWMDSHYYFSMVGPAWIGSVAMIAHF